MNNEIKSIDQVLQVQIKKLQDLAINLKWEPLGEFVLGDTSNDDSLSKLNHMGVYLFEVEKDIDQADFESWYEIFKEKWEDEEYPKKHTPKLIKKRKNASERKDSWIPLYIGKSQDIQARINEHLTVGFDQSTSALKLNARKNLVGYRFRLSFIRLIVDEYGAIMPVVESALRERDKPILGRQ
ncbi:hypothetical protein Oweho_3421 [Owenweeksia hongkongensis DSM 17368]|uniref:GIY-YIG domain-containing protein n=1 Tax=Owenweeksia hongkongensis (strain DSM 17368 / CIP 108786 / JCM 12287 / NRRL B-23963 / UST20020801) TaxID=926562 RepID=G8R5Q4_OWEHD|nr:hypothetical protein [Owenweeksia hongkongensis]AEV34370.1 hypothetical protein Oweho_3421 [Owenweeksia hongkongensis DSM 17368]